MYARWGLSFTGNLNFLNLKGPREFKFSYIEGTTPTPAWFKEPHNKMGIQALVLILFTTLNLNQREVLLLLLNTSTLFPPSTLPDPLPRYVRPMRLEELRACSHLPDSVPMLEEEVARQHQRLEDLHRRLVRARECGG